MNNSKRSILEKSFGLFLTKSYTTVTMKEIQDAVGISRGAIYHYFSSKEEIYQEIVNEYLLPIFSSYTVIEDGKKDSLINAINASLQSRQNHLNELRKITSSKLTDYYFFKFLFQATEYCSNFTEQVNLLAEKEFNGWRNIIQHAMRRGEIRSDIDIDFTARYFITSPMGLGIFSAFSKYINANSNDNRYTYIQFYNLLKKPLFG